MLGAAYKAMLEVYEVSSNDKVLILTDISQQNNSKCF